MTIRGLPHEFTKECSARSPLSIASYKELLTAVFVSLLPLDNRVATALSRPLSLITSGKILLYLYLRLLFREWYDLRAPVSSHSLPPSGRRVFALLHSFPCNHWFSRDYVILLPYDLRAWVNVFRHWWYLPQYLGYFHNPNAVAQF